MRLIGAKDISAKALETYRDVFADIVNVLLFHGERRVSPEDLEEQTPEAAYIAEGTINEMQRDVEKRWMNRGIRIASIGFENQSQQDSDMPIRVIGYDGTEYRASLRDETGKWKSRRERKESKVRYPVITMILYFGHEHRWSQSKTLLECLTVPEGLEPYVSDYKINVFDLAFLGDEVVEMFQSDFRFIVEWLRMKRNEEDYRNIGGHLNHLPESLMLLSALAMDTRYMELFSDKELEREEGCAVCEIWDRIENVGREKGLAEGMEAGQEQIVTLLSKLYETGREADVKKVLCDASYRSELLAQFTITA